MLETPPSTNSWAAALVKEIGAAKAALASNTLSATALDEILQLALNAPQQRQRLLYLHAALPNIYAPIVAAALHEPLAGSITTIDPLAPELPYQSVQDALLEGWRVIHFPDQRAPFDDREIDIVGYEFILEKLEAIHE